MKTLIIADDLSGAADCAVAFGGRALVLFAEAPPDHKTPDVDLLAIDADTRAGSAAHAAEQTALLLARHAKPGVTLFKKIDSTLRGHIGVEIQAALKTLEKRKPLVIVAPSFPQTGRILRGGRLYLDGTPLEKTPFWRQEKMQGDADLVTLLRHAGLKAVLAAPHNMAAAMAESNVLVCDAESQRELEAIVAAGRGLRRTILWVGAGGLARALATQGGKPPRLTPVKGNILFLVGSQSAVSRDQALELAQDRDTTLVRVSADMLRASQPPVRRRDVVLMLDCAPQTDPHALVHAFATWAAPQALLVEALFLTGGETAHAVMWRLGAHGLRLLGEVAPGVTLCRAEGGAIHGRTVVTKAGGFGEANAMRLSRDVLRGQTTMRRAKVADARPRIAITMGDAAGVGPEVIMKALAHRDLYKQCRPLVAGDAARLRQAAKLVGSKLKIRSLPRDGLDQARYEHGTVDCLDLKLIPAELAFGKLSPAAGHAAFEYVKLATELAMQQRIEAICTAPLNKEALHAGGHVFPGHTELLAALTGTPEVSMMLTAPGLRVIHVTAHIGLIDAVRKIEPGLVERTIARGMEVLVKARLPRRKIAVCGINPHAGENGLFGHGEEEEKITPAIAACRARGWDVEGPLPADTLFFRASRGDFDMVVAMYHDQGHGPVKVLGLEAGVNITVGLPVIRTSVDHGTAFDIAGTGKADERSMLEALRQAIALAPRPN